MMFGHQIMFLASEEEGCCFMWDITRYKLGLRVRFQLSSDTVEIKESEIHFPIHYTIK